MNCSSTEALFERFLEDELGPAARSVVITHVDRCAGCSSVLEELRVIDALMRRPRRVELAPNFTFAIMAEARACGAPALRRAPLRAYLVSYLAAAWLLAGAAWLFAPQTMRALTGTILDIARSIVNTFGGVGSGIVRFFGHDGNTLTAVLGSLLVLDGVLVAGVGFALRYVRPHVMERLRS